MTILVALTCVVVLIALWPITLWLGKAIAICAAVLIAIGGGVLLFWLYPYAVFYSFLGLAAVYGVIVAYRDHNAGKQTAEQVRQAQAAWEAPE